MKKKLFHLDLRGLLQKNEKCLCFIDFDFDYNKKKLKVQINVKMRKLK